MEKTLTAKDVKKDIGKIKKDYPINKCGSNIKRVAQQKKAIKEYFEKNHNRIDDNDLVDIYNNVFNPNILKELSIGVISGLCATMICETVNQLDYNIIANIVIYVIMLIGLAFLIFFSYKNIISMCTYTDEVQAYQKELVLEYIKKREEKYSEQETESNNNEENKMIHEIIVRKRTGELSVRRVSKDYARKRKSIGKLLSF